MEQHVMRGMKHWCMVATLLLAAAPATFAEAPASRPRPRLMLGEPAPEVQVLSLEGKPLALGGLREEGKVLVLQFGSLTEPVFRSHVPAVEKLANKDASKATFVIVYQQEAHGADTEQALEINTQGGFAIMQPMTISDRQKTATQAVERLKIKNQKMVVDTWNNATAGRYGSLPNMTFIIDASGKLQAGYPWMDPAKVEKAIDLLAGGKPLPPELRGSVRSGGAMALDYTGTAMDMTGGRGMGAVALTLDNLKLTVDQKQAIYPALGQYHYDMREFRDAKERSTRKDAQALAAVTDPPMKLKSPEEALESLKASAAKLKEAIKSNLSEKDAKTLLDALEQGNAQRFFRD